MVGLSLRIATNIRLNPPNFVKILLKTLKSKKMKKFLALLTFTLVAVSTFAQKDIQNVFVERTIDGNQISLNVRVAGPGRLGGHMTVLEDYQITSMDNYDITSMDITFYAPLSNIDELDVNIPMNPSTGARWAGYAFGSNATGIFDRGIVTIRQANGVETRWEIVFNLGTGTRTSSSQAGTKTELL